MREQRRRRKVALTVESLDDRMVPSVIGALPANQAAVAAHHAHQSNAHHAHANHARLHAESRAGARAHHARVNRVRLHARQGAAIVPAVATPPAVAIVQPSVAVPASPVSTAAAPSTPLGSRPGLNAILPTSGPSTGSSTPTVILDPTVVKNGPLAKAGQDLIALYQRFQQGGAASITSTGAGGIKTDGTNVGIEAHMASGDFSKYIASLNALGLKITATDPGSGTVEGMLPIAQLPPAAQNTQTLSLVAIYNAIPQGMIR